MEQLNTISDELKSMNSPLVDMSRGMPFALPESYFDSFPGLITEKLVGAETSINKQMPFDIPQDYFDSFADTLKTSLHTNAAPKNPMVVPAGYFEQLSVDMLAKAKISGKKTKVIDLVVWRNVRWAAAALFILMISIGSYSILNTMQKPDTEKALAALPASAIHEYIQHNIDEFDTELIVSTLGESGLKQIKTDNLTDEEILQFLDATENTTELN